jgi:hypothetical protein
MNPINENMSRKERLVGAGVLAVIGASSLILSQVPGFGSLNMLRISNLVPLSYVIASLSLIIALALSLYISPAEHLWGNDDPPRDRECCRHLRH